MPSYRLLALDVDGTLVNSRDELTEPTRRALGRAAAAGVRVVLATGRRYRRVLPLVEALGIDAPVITASGALVKRPSDHATLYRAAFGPGVLGQTLAMIAGHGHQAILYADTFAEGFDFFCATLETNRPELQEFFDLNPGCHRLWHETEPPEGVFAGFAMARQEEMLALATELQQRLPDQLYVHVLRSPRYRGYMCEIAPAGVSKWAAIERLALEWRIPREAICAVGDDVNDIPMIRSAALGVAMGNALPEVKQAADRVAPAHDENGLVQVVEWLLDGR